MIAATSSKAVVSVADPAMAARIHGAVIRPKDAKAIAIPLDPEYAGVRPKAVWDRDRLFVWKNKEGKPFIAKTSGDGELNVVYRLASQVIHHPHHSLVNPLDWKSDSSVKSLETR